MSVQQFSVTLSDGELTLVKVFESPLHRKMDWKNRPAGSGRANLGDGVCLDLRFEDPQKVLETAYADFQQFLAAAGIPQNDSYRIVTDHIMTKRPETFRVVVKSDRCAILAGDTEGIRRGLVWVEDQMLSARGPFLPLGTLERVPQLRLRIGHRLIGTQDNQIQAGAYELTDGPAMYPESYLNRLAHDGVNALWFRAHFDELLPSTIIPEYGKNSELYLHNLRRLVDHCLRYGIKLFVFCIEPAAFRTDGPILKAHPELGGHQNWGTTYFCPSSPQGRAYLEEATRTLFTAVPRLGGLIDICVGERPTHCYSLTAGKINCPRCSKRKPWEVLGDTLAAMHRGMKAAAPEADLIAWPYSQYLCWGEELTRKAAAHVPPGVILQHNHESTGVTKQLGKIRRIDDYSLSYTGPSKLFEDCARAAVKKGTEVSAKLQVGLAFETSTVPYIPVPGNLYRKYKAFHRLNITAAMQGWYSGHTPSVMTKAAALLSFKPFPKSEDRFLIDLAKIDWAADAPRVAGAWKKFRDAFDNFPLSRLFGYYGPMNEGPVWPLHLEPKDTPLTQNWLVIDSPPGDRIGECVGYSYTLEEILTLCRRLTAGWRRGVKILEKILPRHQNSPDRVRDVAVAQAIGLLFECGWNILKFYDLREKLPFLSHPRRRVALDQLQTIVRREIDLTREMADLIALDPRIGYDIDATAYKYTPKKLRQRIRQLQKLLAKEFPKVRKQIEKQQPVFAAYTGIYPQGPAYRCKKFSGPLRAEFWSAVEPVSCFRNPHAANPHAGPTVWKACHDGKGIYFNVSGSDSRVTPEQPGIPLHRHYILLLLEPRRLWPCLRFVGGADGTDRGADFRGLDSCEPLSNTGWTIQNELEPGAWQLNFHIPFHCLPAWNPNRKKLRLNLIRLCSDATAPNQEDAWWIKPLYRTPQRLMFHGLDLIPNFGWLIME